jgi:RHS repeat-associated protein
VSRGFRSSGRFALVAVACATLLGVAVSPAYGSESTNDSGTPVLGDFAIGDGLEAMIGEADGSLELVVPVAGLDLRWSSRSAHAEDELGLGSAWSLPTARLKTDGGVELITGTGESYPLDREAPSGLSGYTLDDLKLVVLEGDQDQQLPARADGAAQRDERAAYLLAELGGRRTWFDAAGKPLVQLDRHDRRHDWIWASGDRPRLERVVDADGVVTELARRSRVVEVRRGVNLPAEADGADRSWRIDLDRDGTIERITDPLGSSTTFSYDGSVLTRVDGPTGAATEIAWQSFDDGVLRVERVRTVTDAEVELSARTWARLGGTPSGWPLVDGSSGGVSETPFETVLSDEVTKVRSGYSAQHQLRSREIVSAGAAGDRTLQRQEFEYPRQEGAAAAGRVQGTLQSRPIGVTLTRFDTAGASRESHGEFGYDRFGRVVREVAEDGTITTTGYDDDLPPDVIVPGGLGLPIGLPERVVVSAPDGLVRAETSALNDARTAVLATETVVSGGAAKLEPTTTDRVEFEVAADGFVTERREFPAGDGAAEPLVTAWSKRIDADAGMIEITETVAAGSASAASTTETTSLLHGGIVETTDVFGHEATTAYDLIGREVASTDVAGRTTTTMYETLERDGRNATVVETPDEVVTTEELDELGRPIRRTDNIDHGVATKGHVRVIETLDRSVPGTVSTTDAWGATTSSSIDAFGRLIREVAPTGLTRVIEYDDVNDRVITGLTPTGRLADAERVTTEQWQREARTTVRTIDRADGATVPDGRQTIDGFGRIIADSDGFARTTAEYDGRGNPTTMTVRPETADAGAPGVGAASELTAVRRFDVYGNSIEKQLADGTGATTSGEREFDALGRTRSETDRAGISTEFEYTLDGLVEESTSSDGQHVVSEYDERTRALVSTVTSSPVGAEVRTAYEHDPATGRVTAVFDPADRAGTEISTEYDAHGNVLRVTYPGGVEVEHAYDANGRHISTTDATDHVTTLEYDDAGLLIAAVQRGADGAELARTEYEFDGRGRVSVLKNGNDVVTEIAYTSAGEIARETTVRGDQPIADRAYEYDGRGLLTERIDRVTSDGAEHVTATRYRYDERERLIASAVHDGEADDAPTITATDYELSVAGDILAETITTRAEDGGAHSKTRRFEYTPIGELVAITDEAGRRLEQRYDASGNLTQAADDSTFTYNAQNRPVTETVDGTTITTEYWADGTRRKVETEGADGVRSTEFVWDGGTLVGETHRQGDEITGTASYLIGAGRHARTTTRPDGFETNVLTADRHGNVTELTDADGTVVERYGYADYGREVTRGAGGIDVSPADGACGVDGVGDPARNPFRYAGEYTDPTCRQNLDVRSYDLATMRFISADPAAVMNPYGYTDANPVMRVDPTGNTPQDDYTMTPTERAWNFVSFGVSIAGLIGSALSFLAPMGPFALAVVIAAAAADLVSLATSSIRWGLDGTLNHEQSQLLGELDMFAGAAAIGVSFGARAVGKRIAGMWAARGLASSSIDDSAELVFSRSGPRSGPPRSGNGVSETSPLSSKKVALSNDSRSSDDLRFTATGKTPTAHVKKQGVYRLPQDQTFVTRSQGNPPTGPSPVSPQRSTVQPRVDDPGALVNRPAQPVTVTPPKSKVQIQRSSSSGSSSSSSSSDSSTTDASHGWWKVISLW